MTKWNIEIKKEKETETFQTELSEEDNLDTTTEDERLIEPLNLQLPLLNVLDTMKTSNISLSSETEEVIKEGYKDNSNVTNFYENLKEFFNNSKHYWKQMVNYFLLNNIIFYSFFLKPYNEFITYFEFKFSQYEYELGLSNYVDVSLLCVSIFITYNLFYLFFYNETGSDILSIIRYILSKFPQLYFLQFLNGPINIITLSVFAIPEKINCILPFIISREHYYKIIFITLFLFSVWFTTNLFPYIYYSFVTSIKFEKGNMTDLMIGLIVFYAIYKTIYDEMQSINPAKFNFMYVIIALICFFALVVFSTLNAWYLVFLYCVLLFSITLFPMFISGNFNVFKIFTKINEFCKKPYKDTNKHCFDFQKVKNDVNNLMKTLTKKSNELYKVNNFDGIPTNNIQTTNVSSDPPLAESGGLDHQKKSDDIPSFFSKLCDFLINTTYNFIFVIAFVVLFSQQILMYHKKFKHQTLKNTFIVICVIFILLIFSITSGSVMYQ